MQFVPLISFPDGGDDSFFHLHLAGGSLGNVPVPLEQLLINGQPLVGSFTDGDGTIWGETIISAPAGELVPLKLTTTNPTNNDYTFNVQATNVQLKIFAITNETAIDLSTNTPEFCVGQKVTFYGVWDRDPGAVSTNYAWAFSTKFVNHSSQASQYASTNWDIDSNIFTTNEPYAYWVSGGNKNVYLHEILHFSNDQNATVSASGQFSMYRPQTHVTTVTGTVAIDDNDILILTPIALHYGTPNDTPGITFSNMVAITNGSIKWLQVINYRSEGLQRNDGSWIHEPTITNALDNSDPYGSYSDDINTTADSPGFGPSSPSQFQTLSASNSFSMWLEFKPDGGIWVPLRVVNWSWNGNAVRSGTNWVLTSDPNPDPNPSDSDTTTFPIWTSVSANSPSY